MGRIFKGQCALRITLKTFIDLEGIEAAVIKYRKPGGIRGEFAAGVSDAEKGIIIHECIEGELDRAGWWSFWAFITFGDGRTAAGETARVFVWDEGG
ncbi:hypothetical protein FACS189468_9450 [Spirochaetia bacterium]|nr:hypothetical protein FACS189468_9450 [Spirochaetia bacterium]